MRRGWHEVDTPFLWWPKILWEKIVYRIKRNEDRSTVFHYVFSSSLSSYYCFSFLIHATGTVTQVVTLTKLLGKKRKDNKLLIKDSSLWSAKHSFYLQIQILVHCSGRKGGWLYYRIERTATVHYITEQSTKYF